MQRPEMPCNSFGGRNGAADFALAGIGNMVYGFNCNAPLLFGDALIQGERISL